MKAIWSGSIGFGLVNIPVKLYSAVKQSELDLDMLDKKDHSNIKFQRVNASTGRVVSWQNIVKGYKINDRYVVLEDEDFEKASPEKNKIIEIKEFSLLKDIDSIFFETPYYLEPAKGGGRAFALLAEALKKTGKVGLGSFVLRNRESLVIIRPYENVLLLNKIRFYEEIRSTDEIKIPKVTLKSSELKIATQLVNQLTHDFSITKYKDTYSSKLMKLIKAKAKGKKSVTPKLRVVHSKGRDLMDQLKASLESGRKAS